MAVFEDFEGLSVGDLNGQNSWSGSADFDVQTSVVQEGTNAVSVATSSVSISKASSFNTSDTISVRMRTTATNARRGFRLRDASSNIIADGLFYTGSDISMLKSGGYVTLGTLATNTWHNIELEWNGTQIRGRVDGGTWSSFFNPFAGSTTTPSSLELFSLSAATGTTYFDNIVVGSVEESNSLLWHNF